MVFKIGFTASRNGMPEGCADTLYLLLKTFMDAKAPAQPRPEFWHGDCKGGDEEAHNIARYLGYFIHIWPQNTNPKWRAHCSGDEIHDPMAPLARNRVIVNNTDLLLAAPPQPYRVRSGSWMTYNYAIDQKRRAWLL